MIRPDEWNDTPGDFVWPEIVSTSSSSLQHSSNGWSARYSFHTPYQSGGTINAPTLGALCRMAWALDLFRHEESLRRARLRVQEAQQANNNTPVKES
jgi:hypothetical protein